MLEFWTTPNNLVQILAGKLSLVRVGCTRCYARQFAPHTIVAGYEPVWDETTFSTFVPVLQTFELIDASSILTLKSLRWWQANNWQDTHSYGRGARQAKVRQPCLLQATSFKIEVFQYMHHCPVLPSTSTTEIFNPDPLPGAGTLEHLSNYSARETKHRTGEQAWLEDDQKSDNQ